MKVKSNLCIKFPPVLFSILTLICLQLTQAEKKKYSVIANYSMTTRHTGKLKRKKNELQFSGFNNEITYFLSILMLKKKQKINSLNILRCNNLCDKIMRSM